MPSKIGSTHKYLRNSRFLSNEENRFYARVLLPDENGCMIWIGGNRGKTGYGQHYRMDESKIGAHQYSYMLHHGEIPKGMLICHTCDNPICVAPDHLFLGTPRDNVVDMFRKDRHPTPKGDGHHASKIKECDIPAIMELHREGLTQRYIAKLYQVGQATIHNLVTGKSYKHIKRY